MKSKKHTVNITESTVVANPETEYDCLDDFRLNLKLVISCQKLGQEPKSNNNIVDILGATVLAQSHYVFINEFYVKLKHESHGVKNKVTMSSSNMNHKGSKTK